MSEKSKRKNTPIPFASLYLRKRLSIMFPAVFMPVFVLVYALTSYAGLDFAPQLGWDLPVIFVALTLFGFLSGHFAGERLQPLLENDITDKTLAAHIARWSVAVTAVWYLATIWKLGGIGTLFGVPLNWLVRRACYACVDAYANNGEKAKHKPKNSER